MNSLYEELIARAKTAFINEEYEAAVNLCNKALEFNSNTAEVFLLAGNACLILDKLEKAETYFESLIKLEPNEGEYYFHLANSLFGQQRISEALENYARATQLGCRDEVLQKVYYIIGVINQSDSKNYNNALVNYEKSMQIKGDNEDLSEILLKKIQIYVEQRMFAEAELCAIQLNLLLPTEFQSYQLLFQIYLEQKKIKEAKQILQEAEANIDADAETAIEIGFDKAMLLCFVAEQSEDKAEEYYQRAVRQLASLEKNFSLSAKDKCEILITSAEIYMKLQQYDRSVVLAERAVSLKDAELIEYRERGEYILLSCADLTKDYEAAVVHAQHLKKSDNLFYQHHGHYAEAYASKKLADAGQSVDYIRLYEIAIAYYKNAVVSAPGDILAYLYRAKSYVDIAQYDRAKEIAELLPEDSKKELYDYISEVEKE